MARLNGGRTLCKYSYALGEDDMHLNLVERSSKRVSVLGGNESEKATVDKRIYKTQDQ